jgi:ABC-type sugar transport system permease subunit
MFLFIALPIVSVAFQSLYIEHEQVLIEVENCGPFGCENETVVDAEASAAIRDAEPLGRFNGLGTYFDRGHLAAAEISEAWASRDSFGGFMSEVMNLPFYRALVFTLTYTFVCTPLIILLGLAIALGVNGLPKMLKGPTIFVSLLPMIITPLIGSLILFWMIDAEGVIGNHTDRLWCLEFGTVCLRRLLCRVADRARGHAGGRDGRRGQSLGACALRGGAASDAAGRVHHAYSADGQFPGV